MAKIAKVSACWDDSTVDELAVEPSRMCSILNVMCKDEDDAVRIGMDYVEKKGPHVSNVVVHFIKFTTDGPTDGIGEAV
jgi:hypothetical protein